MSTHDKDRKPEDKDVKLSPPAQSGADEIAARRAEVTVGDEVANVLTADTEQGISGKPLPKTPDGLTYMDPFSGQ